MTITTFAAISVGSFEIEMKIFEMSKKHGIREIDRVSHIIELGRETYNYQKISFETVDELCQVLYDFSVIMKSYGVEDYVAAATSAIREAINVKSIIDRIKVRTGLDVEVISNSEQRFISYRAFAIKEKNFDSIIKKGTLLIDMGAGSAQVTLFDKGELITTQNIRLGALRIRELLSKSAKNATNYREIIEEYIDNDIETLSNIFLKDTKISNIIGTGENMNSILSIKMNQRNEGECLTSEQFSGVYSYIMNHTEQQLGQEIGVTQTQASLILPSIMFFKRMFDYTKAENLWSPNVVLTDGIAVEYAQKNKILAPSHDFMGDILSATRVIAKRYMCNQEHTDFVEKVSLLIFDAMKKYHGLGKREKLILQISAILHDSGKYASLIYPAEAAYNMIMGTEIIGLSHMERVMVAQIVKYNTIDFDYNRDIVDGEFSEIYLTVTKLTSILRVANALDRSHKQKMNDIKVTVKDNILDITTQNYYDITLEKGLFQEKAKFFEEVYGIKPIINQRKK